MNKTLKPAIKEKRLVKKPPKEVTLMIESKMLQQTQTKSDLRVSTNRHSKGIPQQSSPDGLAIKSISLRDMSLTQRISCKQLRPSTSRNRITAVGFSSSKYQQGDFPFRPRINSKSRSLSRNRELSQPKSCRHSKCADEHQHEMVPQQVQLNPISNFKCFERLLYRVTSYFENEKVCWEFRQLTYSNVLALLHRLGYIPQPTESELIQGSHSDSLKKAYHFWLYVSADELTATLENFFVLVCAIQKIYVDAPDIARAIAMFVNYLCRKSTSFQMDPAEPPEYRWILPRSGRTFGPTGELQLDPSTINRIPSDFSLFIVNRLNSHLEKAVVAEHSQNTPPVAAPLLSDRSNRLAQGKRRKMIEIIRNRKPNVQTVTLHDILNFKARTTEDSERPTLLTNISNQSNHYQQPHRRQLKISASQLCFLSRPKRVVERHPRDLEFERVEHICTFQPEIHDVRKAVREQSLTRIPNVDKSIERMKEGRLFRKEKKRLIETGWTNSESRRKVQYRSNKQNQFKGTRRGSQQQDGSATKQLLEAAKIEQEQQHYHPPRLCNEFKPTTQPTCESSFKLPTEEALPENIPSAHVQLRTETVRSDDKQLRIPLLFIDINIDETKKERIVIYDEDSSEKLADEFARRHNLDPEMQAKLRELLQYQMSSILTKIEEEAEEQQNF